jgi:hypothetical protein
VTVPRPARRVLTAQVYADRLGPLALQVPAAGWAARAHWQRLDVQPFLPERGEVDAEHAAVVVVNRSAWLARCPFCPSAQYAAPTDPRFFCCDCLNEAVAYQWVRAVWPAPAERAAIEAALAVRPLDVANWEPPETAAALAAENARMGWG